ncbi:hypothetical protein PV379_41240 [Streptomyces caniscabiei]|uniref:hypothetical protein n=1 Tax=Streptomyces caniscabiei TaxID=2746961 RepID=UPI0029A0F38C|nr:hypothetical protein [Streptomyces caniscabiei]MDX2599632.1 hypothetical protein [Streptomyces caniscabiei]MDX2735073.1 hypothetical protein [Streptomyces caniscabiei]MDX2783693.1 hypothetical protein [Streptomyces caniscabiei]
MTVSIIHTCVLWILGVLAPGTGRRRADTRPAGQAPARALEAPRACVPWPPLRRSPYGVEESLPGEATAVVRPYVVLAERERERAGEWALQRQRRIAMVLAADFGIDLDRHVVGAEAVA